MTIQASLEVTQLLEKLFKGWAAWDQNRSYYLDTLLPELKVHPERGTPEEKAILRDLKRVATPQEWDQLEAIGRNLTDQRKKIQEISLIFDRFFEQDDFHSAEMFLTTNGGSSVQQLYDTKKRNAIGRIWRTVFVALDRFDFEKAELKIASIKPQLSEAEIAEYQSHLKEQQKAFVDTTILEIGKACEKFDYNLAEQYYLLIDHLFPREKFNALIETAKQHQAQEFLAITINEIIAACNNNDYNKAESLYVRINHLYSKEAYNTLIQEVKQRQEQEYLEQSIFEIREACENYNYNLAEAIYSRISQSFPVAEFNSLINEAKLRQATEERSRSLTKTVQSIHHLLERYEFCKADELYAQVKDMYSEEAYLDLVEVYKRKQARENFLLSLHGHLEASDYHAADRLFHSSDIIDYEEYLRIKSPYIQKFVQNQYSIQINPEKAKALASTSPNLLLSARAGSGKTTVLACKASMLIDCEQVHLDQILILAFNKSAANEIRNKICRDFKKHGFENSRTFHSLAHQLVRPTEDLLYDETDDVITRKMSLFVQQLLKEQIRNPVFIEKMYAFFRKEMREIERAGFFLDEEAYFDFRRNLLQVTLNGERVKSVGEKMIADYLFEHDISYGYEKVWLWSSQIYRPDFSIYEQQKDYVIEYWGIDENDPAKQVPQDWSQTWEEYYAEMQAKRAFWNEKSVVLIETSIRDLRNGREAFEAILKSRLVQAGINKPKLTSAELLHKIRDKDYTITRLSELFTQFIQRAKKQMLKAYDVQNLMQTYQPKDDREEVFLDLACRVYMEYEQSLIRQQKIDFDDLMMRATHKVHETKGECEISLGNPKNRTIRMNDLRWILIDEYQDFSELFYRLITAIQKYNPRVQLFCVGDDWQAINGFAGSDLQFFDKYREWVKEGQVAYLLTNFRSQAAIVRAGNALMQGCGRPGEHLPQNSGGDVQIGYMDDIWIELRNNGASVIQKTDDERFLITEAATNGNDKKYNRIVASKYLKKCYQIITSPENQGKSIAILSRTNWIDGVRLNEFKNRLIASLTPTDLKTIEDPKNKIHVQTAHKYKGLEADLVIILGACNGAFPLLHPDNALFEIFGKTLLDAFEEERRLFYVALTRAKTSLYILTEKGRESVFLKRIPGYQPNQSSNGWPARSSQYASPLFGSDEEEIPF